MKQTDTVKLFSICRVLCGVTGITRYEISSSLENGPPDGRPRLYDE